MPKYKSFEELPVWQEAARLYTAKCARCHKFYNPADYNDAEWQMWMNKMSHKARLKSDQAQLLSQGQFKESPFAWKDVLAQATRTYHPGDKGN